MTPNARCRGTTDRRDAMWRDWGQAPWRPPSGLPPPVCATEPIPIAVPPYLGDMMNTIRFPCWLGGDSILATSSILAMICFATRPPSST
jgi:hypothetical protein